MSRDPPAEWPNDVKENYTPIRIIGRGGFASVWMARPKKPSSDDDHVAIKVMQDDGYARREVTILSELSTNYSHPNIVRLLWPLKAKEDDACKGTGSSGVKCIVLSLARGRTLNSILEIGGAVGVVLSQSISRQLIDAISFLHGHAVIHRDIQPCNIIVSGAQVDNDLWWSDTLDLEGDLLKMSQQCHVTLVDFGFARALSRDDIQIDHGLKKALDVSRKEKVPECVEDIESKKQYDASCVTQALTDPSLVVERRGRGRSRNLDDSISHSHVRDLSALGTRNYAAPEILSGIRDVCSVSSHSLNNSSRRRPTKTLGKCVSNYGMDADAFSVGATIRHMVTGVPPGEDVEEFIARKNRPVKKLVRSVSRRISKKHLDKRVKQYCTGADLPAHVNDLVQSLTHYNSLERATVRSVTKHPWIKLSANSGKEKERGGEVLFLECGKV